MDVKLLIAILIILLIVVGIGAFYAGTLYGKATPTPTPTSAATPAPQQTSTPAPQPVSQWQPPAKIKAAWVYVGPIGDFGWTYAHDTARRVVATLFKDWLETTYVENVDEFKVAEVIDSLVAQGYTVIFTTSFDHMEKTYEKAAEYPNVMFFHCSGYKRRPNMATYFADFYQIYYLNGLMAGALTKTGRLGYVAAHTIPEVVRHINAFAIGAQEMARLLGKEITVYVIEIGAWFAPEKAKAAAATLYEQYGIDVIAFTEDSTAIIEYAEEKTKEYLEGKADRPLYVFSHYSPGYVYGPNAVVSGQLVRWEVIYADILVKIKAGVFTPYNLENVDYWYLLNTGAVELGAHVFENGTVMTINPKFIPVLKGITVTDPVFKDVVTAYDYIMRRYYIFKEAPLLQPLQFSAISHIYESVERIRIPPINPAAPDPASKVDTLIATLIEPFTGPLEGYKLADPSQKVFIPAGQRLTHDDLWTMDWFLTYVKYIGKV